MKRILPLFVILLLIGCTINNFKGDSGTFKDSRDRNVYEWVRIGEQIWMAENLAYLPEVSPSTEGSDSDLFYYVYNNEGTSVSAAKATDNYGKYGVIYNWEAAKMACPTGWHLPSDGEWTILTDYLTNNGYGYGGSGSDIGKSMASTSGWKSSSSGGDIGNDQSSNNSSGFAALPGGFRNYDGGFYGLGKYAYFWSSSEDGSSYAWVRGLDSNDDDVGRYDGYRRDGASVRCLKN